MAVRADDDRVIELLSEITGGGRLHRISPRKDVLKAAIKEMPNWPGDYTVMEAKNCIRATMTEFLKGDPEETGLETPVDVSKFESTPKGDGQLLSKIHKSLYGRTIFFFLSEGLAHEDFLKAVKRNTGINIVVIRT